jgi:hypothetical protein
MVDLSIVFYMFTRFFPMKTIEFSHFSQDEATRTWEMLTARCGSREVTVEDFVWAVKGASRGDGRLKSRN